MKTSTIVIFLVVLQMVCMGQDLQSDDAIDGVVYIPSGFPIPLRADSDHSLTYLNGFNITALPVNKDRDILRYDGLQVLKADKYQSDKYLLTYKKLPEVRQTPDTNLYSGNSTYYSDRGETDGPVMFSTYNKQSESEVKKYGIEKNKVMPRAWSY